MTGRAISRTRLIGSASASIVCAAFVRAPAGAAQFELKAGANFATSHPIAIRAKEMFEAIERETGGRLHVEFFPNSLLGGDAAMLSQVRVGALTFFIVGAGNLASVVQAPDIANLGFAFKDEDEAFRAIDGPIGDYIRNEIAAKGLYALRTIWDSGMLHVGSTPRPLKTPDDFRGFKIRVAISKITFELFRELGATPSSLAVAEVYTALQTKLIDGEATPLVVLEAAKFYEVNKYVSLTNHQWADNWLIANGETWKNLPQDIQGIVQRNNSKYALLARKDVKVANAAAIKQLTSQGLEINRVDPEPFRARLGGYYRAFESNFGPTAWSLLQKSIGHKLT